MLLARFSASVSKEFLATRVALLAALVLTSCAHVDRDGTLGGLLDDALGPAYASHFPDERPGQGDLFWVRSRRCEGPDDLGAAAVAYVRSEYRVWQRPYRPVLFWLPCRDDGVTLEEAARSRGLELSPDRALKRAAGEKEQVLSGYVRKHENPVHVFVVGEGPGAVVLYGTVGDLTSFQLPVVDLLAQLGRERYPPLAQREELRRAAATRQVLDARKAWLEGHRAGAIAAYARGQYTVALAHLLAERWLWTGRRDTGFRGWSGEPLLVALEPSTPLAVAIHATAAHLEAEGPPMAWTVEGDDAARRFLESELSHGAPWVRLLPAGLPPARNVFAVKLDTARLFLSHRTVTDVSYRTEEVHDAAAEAALDARRKEAARSAREHGATRVEEIDRAIEEIDRKLERLPGPRAVGPSERVAVGPQAHVQICTPLPGGGQRCEWKDKGLYDMRPAAIEDPGAQARDELTSQRSALYRERIAVREAMDGVAAPARASVVTETRSTRLESERGVVVADGPVDWSLELRRHGAVVATGKGQWAFDTKYFSDDGDFRISQLEHVREALWEPHLRKGDRLWGPTCWPKWPRKTDPQDFLEHVLRVQQVCGGYHPGSRHPEEAQLLESMVPPAAIVPSAEERTAWAASPMGAGSDLP